VVLLLEGVDVALEGVDDGLNVLKVVLFEGLELLDGGEEFLQLCDSAAKQVKLAKNLSGVEVELLCLGHVLKSFLGKFVLLHVGFMEVEAGLEDLDELIWGVLVVVPQDGIVNGASFLTLGLLGSSELTDGSHTKLDAAEVDDTEAAVGDHLVGDLDEEAGHTFVGVVVTGDGVDHLDGVHKSGKGILDALRGAVVKGLDELLKGLEVLDVVLGLVKSLGDAQLDASPLAGGKVDLVTGAVGAVVGALGSVGKHIEDGTTVLGAELFGHASEFAHPLLPVFKFLAGASFFVLLFLGLGFFEGLFDLFRPLVEDLFEVTKHVRAEVLGVVDIHSILLMLWWVGFQDDVGSEGENGFTDLFGKAVESLHEFLFLLGFTAAPVGAVESVDKRLVHVVDYGVEGEDRVLANFTEQYLVVVSTTLCDWLARGRTPHEVDTLTLKLEFLTYKVKLVERVD
jgi:hypothetical protein